MHITTRRMNGRPRGKRSGRSKALGATLALVAAGLAIASRPVPAGASSLPVVAANATGNHTCAVIPDGRVFCWGRDDAGQLGDGIATTNSATPVQVASLPPALAIAAGGKHSCAIDTGLGVWCWGSDAFGELGDGTTATRRLKPVHVAGIQGESISAGFHFTCAVTVARLVQCWGYNKYGELGDGTTTNASTPQTVKNLTGVAMVATGAFHACAVLLNGAIFCWGQNAFGQLGTGTHTDSHVPVAVSGVRGVVSVATGQDDTCAVLSGGDLKCWGSGLDGELGDGGTANALVPTQVVGLNTGVLQVSLGQDFSCALVSAYSTTQCWGSSRGFGSLGNGSYTSQSSVPVPVFGLQIPPAGAGPFLPEQITAGQSHACLVLISGKVKCWGRGSGWASIGDGAAADRDVPTSTIGLPGGTGSSDAVSGGVETSCAVTSSLNAACWGIYAGDGGQETTMHTAAVAVAGLPAGQVRQVSAAHGGCAVTTTGGVDCWGDNTWGEIGNGTSADQPAAVTVTGLSNVASVSTGGTHTCAVTNNGLARCWGANYDGQLGDGTSTQRNTPVPVKNLGGAATQMSAADDHTCALLKTGSVRCWGLNNRGQLGDGTTSDSKLPVTVTGLSGVVQIATGDASSCALTSAGAVDCWGDNAFGELGNGTTADSHVPTAVTGLSSGVLAIAAGDAHGCAVLISGQVQCWGDDGSGQLGNGTLTSSTVPVPVLGFSSDGASISADMGSTSCALDSNEVAFCWGNNADGQVGDGTLTDADVPAAVLGL